MSTPTKVSGSGERGANLVCTCPEWHHLRLFGHGRRRANFEDERLGGPQVNGVCPACGHGLSAP